MVIKNNLGNLFVSLWNNPYRKKKGKVQNCIKSAIIYVFLKKHKYIFKYIEKNLEGKIRNLSNGFLWERDSFFPYSVIVLVCFFNYIPVLLLELNYYNYI